MALLASGLAIATTGFVTDAQAAPMGDPDKPVMAGTSGHAVQAVTAPVANDDSPLRLLPRSSRR